MATALMPDRLEKARLALESAGQGHVLRFWEELDEKHQEQLLDQIEGIDWQEVSRLIKTHVKQKPGFTMPENLEPAPWYPNKAVRGYKLKYRRARRLGEKLIGANKVAAFTVAGGQGTRLGWAGPKGTYPATAIRKAPLFTCLAEYIRKAERKFGGVIPWYIMTSPGNDRATHAFFDEHGYFGLDPANVMMFPQAMMPAIDVQTAKVLMAAPDSLALSPNGHGGSLKALHTSGAIADMQQRGIEQISYTQIDNPIVKVVDPLFIGLHVMDNCEMSSKMLPKAYPREKLGNFCLIDGKVTVIEYSNLPDEYAEQRDRQGNLRFRAGSIAIHVIRVDFVEAINREGFALPFNRAEKKVPFVNIETGARVDPAQANAVKLETFVFDALPLAHRSIILEADRIEEFAPIKNADDPDPAKNVDSPSTSIQGQTERAARWLEENGVRVSRDAAGRVDAVIELSNLTAIEADDLAAVDLPESIESETQVLL